MWSFMDFRACKSSEISSFGRVGVGCSSHPYSTFIHGAKKWSQDGRPIRPFILNIHVFNHAALTAGGGGGGALEFKQAAPLGGGRGWWVGGSKGGWVVPPPPPPMHSAEGEERKEKRERIIVVVRSPCQENYPADAHPSALKSVLESANPTWTWSVHRNTPGHRHRQQPVSGTADLGVVKHKK